MNWEEVPPVPEGSTTSEGVPMSPQTRLLTSRSTQEGVSEPENQSADPKPTEDNTWEHDAACHEEFRKGLPDDLLDDLLHGGIRNSTNDVRKSG